MAFFICSFCHLDVVKEFPRFGQIRSKSGPNQVGGEGLGGVQPRQVGPAGMVLVAPPESLGPNIFPRALLLARGDHPNSRKNAPRMQGQMKILPYLWVPSNSGNGSGVAPGIAVFVLLKS